MDEDLQRIHNFFSEYVFGFINNDLNAAIHGNANYLGALGLFSYTEAIGAFLPPLDNESGSLRERRFYRCLFRLPHADEWKNIDRQIRDNTRNDRGIYKHLRHSMTHVYVPTIRKSHNEKLFIPVAIAMSEKNGLPVGINNDGWVILVVKNWKKDLIEGCELFLEEVKKDRAWKKSAISHLDREY